MCPLVLVQNETTYGGRYDHWQDLTGVSYQFPNQYRNKTTIGNQFVYYRGVRRINNQRGQAEYFGVGRIASVWRDPSIPDTVPKAKWHWYCSIEDYVPFAQPVPAKIDGQYLENITNSLGWRTGVREISDDLFERIITLAGLKYKNIKENREPTASPSLLHLPNVDQVSLTEMPNGLDILIRPENPARQPSLEKPPVTYRRTKRAKQIGDRAEELAIQWLRTKISSSLLPTIKWVSKEGKTPGWDIEFLDENGDVVSVEVKGTTGNIFQSIEITAQEWEAAEENRSRYWLVLVIDCIGTHPKITLLQNPFELLMKGDLEISPILWRLRRSSSSTHQYP